MENEKEPATGAAHHQGSLLALSLLAPFAGAVAGFIGVIFRLALQRADFITVKKCLDSGALGEVSYCGLHYDRFVPGVKDRWRERPGEGAGLLYDLGPHLIDQSLCLFGMPVSLFALSAHQRNDAKVDDFFHLVLSYGRLVVVLHASTLTWAQGPRMLVHGDRGSLFQFGLDGQEDASLSNSTLRAFSIAFLH